MDPDSNNLLNRLTILWAFFFTGNALCDGIIIAMANIEWSNLTPTKKVVIGAMVFKNWFSAMIALFTQSASRLEKGKPIIPIDSGSTQTWTKAPDLTTPTPPADVPKP